MIALSEIEKTIQGFAQLGLTIEAAHWLVKIYELEQENLLRFALREAAEPTFILLTTNGEVGDKQIVIIPSNVFNFPLRLILNLLAHEMLHVKQKSEKYKVEDKNEREFQAYYEMLFHKEFPLIPIASDFHKKHFANKAFDYYNRMGEGSDLQIKYAKQKEEVENLLKNL
ncbi:hypothetical protein [Flavobacterium sp.]|uniref:hypothetical protein n=1 Tax=Flavobacterium sp. TaxID=239 RepID=UPI0035296DB0